MTQVAISAIRELQRVLASAKQISETADDMRFVRAFTRLSIAVEAFLEVEVRLAREESERGAA